MENNLVSRHMIKSVLLFTLVFSFLTVFSQDNQSVNQKDARGMKQGIWEYYKIDTLVFENLRMDTFDTLVRHKLWEKGNYTDDKKNGIWKVYTYNLRKKRTTNTMAVGDLLYEVTIRNGVMNGPLKVYSKDGIECLTTVRNDTIKGIYLQFHPNGKMKYKGMIDQSEPFFEGTEFYDTGAKYRDRKFNTEIILHETIDIDRIRRELNL